MIDKNELQKFVSRAQKATYAGGGSAEEHPERSGFFELVYDKELPWFYRDSYTGHSRSGGQEIVRLNNQPVWWSGYGGGMVEDKVELSDQTFAFLKLALSQTEEGFDSLRGPHQFSDHDWKYSYSQDGDIFDYYGYEDIFYHGEKVFWHRAVGGLIVHQ